MEIYYSMINNRTNASWVDYPVTPKNIKAYAAHWIATCKQIGDEFAQEGLPKTADHFYRIAEQHRKYAQ